MTDQIEVQSLPKLVLNEREARDLLRWIRDVEQLRKEMSAKITFITNVLKAAVERSDDL